MSIRCVFSSMLFFVHLPPFVGCHDLLSNELDEAENECGTKNATNDESQNVFRNLDGLRSHRIIPAILGGDSELHILPKKAAGGNRLTKPIRHVQDGIRSRTKCRRMISFSGKPAQLRPNVRRHKHVRLIHRRLPS